MSGLGELDLGSLSMDRNGKCTAMKTVLVCILILVVLYLLIVCTSMMSSSNEGMKAHKSGFIPRFKSAFIPKFRG